ncbi:MAG: hypothetical protein HUN04_08280 [Desulfobacter sp.]|nr:MAG: hypothetical protein HUN04_08280 [Desulfobacter sp.]
MRRARGEWPVTANTAETIKIVEKEWVHLFHAVFPSALPLEEKIGYTLDFVPDTAGRKGVS